jgi:1,4-alpha-glucan branching enzyme
MTLPASTGVDKAEVVGDFNNWEPMTMDQLKDGRFKAVVELDAGNDYQFRYLLNGSEWVNEEEADKYAPNPYAGENSVIAV